jgi:hypothetical protein
MHKIWLRLRLPDPRPCNQETPKENILLLLRERVLRLLLKQTLRRRDHYSVVEIELHSMFELNSSLNLEGKVLTWVVVL